ncbi:MAG: hypothetical protein AAFU79_12555, partial [Myxococcota bacterium]
MCGFKRSVEFLLALMLTAGAPPLDFPALDSPVHGDGRNHRNLLRKRLVNRDLAAQLEPWRLGDELPPFTAAVDAILGTQLPLEGSSPTPFHGFFVADVFLELEVLEGVALNLNLTTLNVTASGGFRVLSDILPGFAVSIHVPWSLFGEEPIYVDFVGPDLDLVTVGQGALLQDVFLEGFMAGLRWRDWELHAIFGGRVFWETDDYLYLGFEWNRRTLGVGYT